LTGPGCFLRTINSETQQFNDASHLSQLVLELEEPIDPDSFRNFFGELVETHPILNASIRRPYFFGTPNYFINPLSGPGANSIRVRQSRSAIPLDRNRLAKPLRQRLNSQFDIRSGELFTADLLLDTTGSLVALTWAHMVFDGFGIEEFIARLSTAWKRWNETGTIPDQVLEDDSESPLTHIVGKQGTGERWQTTREWANEITNKIEGAPDSLSGPLAREKQNLRSQPIIYSREQTEKILDRASSFTSYMKPMIVFLATSMRAHFAVFKKRGNTDPTLLVPVAVNLREGKKPVYGSHVSFFWFKATGQDLTSLSSLVESLKQQRLDMIKTSFHELTATALETVKWCPVRMYRRMIRGPFEGELASFFFSYTGELLPDTETFMGTSITRGTHTPSVPPSPGSSLIFSIHNDRLVVNQIWQDGTVKPTERDLMRQKFESDLLKTDTGSV
jgi:hypothetical protein